MISEKAFLPIKLQRGTQLRRFRLEDVIAESTESKNPFEVLTNFVKESWESLGEFVLKYEDDEHEIITISSKHDLHEAFRLFKELKKKTLRIQIAEEQAEEKKEALKIPMINCLLQYQGETRDLNIPKSSIESYAFVKAQIEDMIPALRDCLVLKYLDDEEDAVTIKEDSELAEAFDLWSKGQLGKNLTFVAD